jgi:hypothetical protein
MLSKILSFFSSICLLLIGTSLGFILAIAGGICQFDTVSAYHWATIFTLVLICFYVLSLVQAKHKNREEKEVLKVGDTGIQQYQAEINSLRTDFERYKRETIHFYKSFVTTVMKKSEPFFKNVEDTTYEKWRKEFLKSLQNGYGEVVWLDEILDEIKSQSNSENGKSPPRK